MRKVIGLGKEVGWEASQAHCPLFLAIFLLQLVIRRLGSLQKYHVGMVKFVLVFSPWKPIFLKNTEFYVIIIMRTLTDL